MLIPFWLAVILLFVLGILIIWISSKIAKKVGKQAGGGGVIGFFVAVALIIYGFIGPSRLYVVNGDKEYSHYMVFGSPEYQFDGGTTILVEIAGGESFVINETKRDIVVEYVIYGGYGFGGETDWIYPNTGETVEKGTIDYFFDDEPPDEISVGEKTDEVVRLWLRERRY